MSDEKKEVSRRAFLKYAAAGVIGLAVGGVIGYLSKPAEVAKETITQYSTIIKTTTVEKTVTASLPQSTTVVTTTITQSPSPTTTPAKPKVDISGEEVVYFTYAGPWNEPRIADAKIFEEKTGCKVKYVAEVPWAAFRDQCVTKLSAGSSEFDIVDVSSWWLPGFVKAGWLEPLNTFIEDPNIVDPELLDIDDFPKSILDGLTIEGKLYGLPWYVGFEVYAYRQDLFEKENLSPPKKMEDFVTIAETLTSDGMYGFSTPMSQSTYGLRPWIGFFQGYGGRFFDEKMRPQINSRAAIKAFELMLELKKYAPPGCLSYNDWGSTVTDICQGRAATVIVNEYYTSWFDNPEKSKFVGKIETRGDTPFKTQTDVLGAGISKFSKHKLAAYKYIEWYTSAEYQKIYVMKSGLNIVCRSSLLEDPEIVKHFRSFPACKYALEKNSVAMPLIHEWSEISDILARYVSKVYVGELDPEVAVEKAQEEVDEIMRRAGYYE